MSKTMICIYCPRGCRLTVDGTDVRGNGCPKGIDYARQEISNPVRMITTTVRTVNRQRPRLPVKLSREIAKPEIMNYMEEINKIIIDHDCLPGDVIASDLLGSGVDLIATGEFRDEK